MNDLGDFTQYLTDDELAKVAPMLERLRKLEDRASKHDNFMSFVKHVWPQFIEGRHHKIYAQKLQDVADGKLKRLIVNMPPRHCLALDTPIMTTSGWKTMSSLRKGDFVFGPDGKPTQVLGKSEVHFGRDCYVVTTDDGASVVCDEGHLWNAAVCRKRPKFRNWTAGELYRRSGHRRAWLPDYSPVEYFGSDLPLDPYTFGVWLGDGSSHDTTITMRPEDQPEVIDRISSSGIVATARKDPMTFGLKGVKVILREMGVLKNKHIPAEYLMASKEDRIALLDGLMDTDGNVSKDRQCFIATSSPVLRDQIRELLWSLGIKNGLSVSRAIFNGRDYGETYRIGFYAVGVGSLSRKKERATGYVKRVRRYISLEKVDSVPVQCIEVAREDGLFLAGHGFLVTHNTKSEFASYLFPTWLMGRRPDLKIIQATHTAELAVGFGRKVKNLIDSDEFRDVFPNVSLASDAKASGRWSTNGGGEYYAVGVGGALAGRGADLAIIDDPVSEQDALSVTALDNIYEWYTSGPRQRLQPGGAIIIVMTRWSIRDLTAKVLAKQSERGADKWEVVEFPAIMPSGDPLWPEFWSLPELESVKASIPVGKWNAQYMQNPTAEEGAIIKREWWNIWDRDEPPPCSYVIQSYDTAFSKSDRADFSAITTWGIFHDDETREDHIILLDAVRGRWEFPELKAQAQELFKLYDPDMILIEQKASGMPLTQELRRMGIPVTPFTPSRGADKFTRMHACAPVFESGMVWAPETNFADEVMEECAAFPNGEHDDLADSMTQAILRFRQGGFITTPTDYDDDDELAFSRRRREYY